MGTFSPSVNIKVFKNSFKKALYARGCCKSANTKSCLLDKHWKQTNKENAGKIVAL